MDKKGKILGVDFGDRRVGLAITDLNQEIAFPRDFLEYGTRKELMERIRSICLREGVSMIALGWPLKMDGGKSERTHLTEAFSHELREALPEIEVLLVDERLSTRYAVDVLRQQSVKAKNQKGKRDSLAAQMILQNYLNARKRPGK